jgi:hypothetical protein
VAFDLHISDADRAFLDNLPLSPEAKDRVNRFVEQFIPNVSDEFRGIQQTGPARTSLTS